MPAARHRAPSSAPQRALAETFLAETRPGETPLRDLLGALAGETAELAASADQLQGLFGQLLADPPLRPADALERAQSLDGLVQRLQGLSIFLAELGSRRSLHDLPAEAAQAASSLRLTSQVRRFSATGGAGPPTDDAGDCQLF